MAFIQVASADRERWDALRCALTFRHGQTVLLARDKSEVVALPDFALNELEEKGIRFTVIPEEKLREVLSPKGFRYYEVLRKERPEHLYFNAELPPLHHVEVSFATPSHLVPAARKLLERHGAQGIEVRDDVVTLRIAVDGPEEALDLAQVSCLAEKRKAIAIRDELMETRIAGFSRETAIFLSRDPDSND